MGRLRLVAGAFGIVLGFAVYQYGLFMMLNLSPILFTWSSALVPWIVSREVLGATFQVIGGALAIVGLLFCIAWIGSQSRARSLAAVPAQAAKAGAQPTMLQRKCKFCGATMEPAAAFCPKCERAQA